MRIPLDSRLSVVFAAALTCVAAAPAALSDPVGVYALIDRVVVTTSPDAIQLWGVFALSTGTSGDSYNPAQRGYVYYRPASDARVTRAEWNDLKAVAGTGQGVGFGGRYAPTGRVRPASEAPQSPDIYPLGFGVTRLGAAHLGVSIARELANVPAQLSPADGATVKPGLVRLVAKNVADSDAKYVFYIDGSAQHEMSGPLSAGNGETSWTPKLTLRDGQNYIWRVRVQKGTWSGQPASSSIRVAK